MSITYSDLKKRKYLDCSILKDMRGRYIYNKVILNAKNSDFRGAVLYKCFCESNIQDALIISPKTSEEEVYISAPGTNLHLSNLMWADLSGADLSGADLSGANLGLANLSKANLQNANLENSTGVSANLQNANLSNTSLYEANFEGADLRGADLRGANLQRVKFKGANLTHVIVRSPKDTFYRMMLSSAFSREQLDSMTFVESEE